MHRVEFIDETTKELSLQTPNPKRMAQSYTPMMTQILSKQPPRTKNVHERTEKLQRHILKVNSFKFLPTNLTCKYQVERWAKML